MSDNSFDISPSPSNCQFSLSPYLLDAGIIILLVFVAVVLNWRMIRNGVIFGSTDLWIHLNWLQHFSKQIFEGIWYPRWLAGTNYGYGSPTFVFYPPLVYYVGSVLKIIGLNANQTIVFLYWLASFGSGLNFFIYGREVWGKIAALTGALAYMTAPYIAFDSYYRGALAETFSLAWIPLGLWLTNKAILQQKRGIVGLTIFFAILALTHVPNLLIFTIIWLFYTLSFLFKQSWKSVVTTIASSLIGFGLVSFYLLPALLEQSLVSVNKMRQVSGGFKANLLLGGLDHMNSVADRFVEPLFLIQLLVIFVIVTVCIACFYGHNNSKISEVLTGIIFMMILGFMMTYPSVRIWDSSRILQMIQFPWRIMGFFSLGVAIICAIAISGISQIKLRKQVIVILTIIGIILGNGFGYYIVSKLLPGFNNPDDVTSIIIQNPELMPRKTKSMVELFDKVKKALYDPFTDKLIDVFEYRPLLKNGLSAPDPVIGEPQVSVVSGKAEIQIQQWGSYERKFNVTAEEVSDLRVRTYYYPAWHLYVDKKYYPLEISDD